MGQEESKIQSPSSDGGMVSSSANIQNINPELKRKLARGVDYNLKVVIRGERKSGKTSLWQRLQGLKLDERYHATEQIQTSNIQWNYKVTDDAVKVEVWDVVDVGMPTKEQLAQTIKVGHGGKHLGIDKKMRSGSVTLNVLDAQSVDVYNGTDAVIVVVNPYDKASVDWLIENMKDIPEELPVLVLANFKDLQGSKKNKAVVSAENIQEFLAKTDHRTYFFESSMINCFGLKEIYNFVNVPFLAQQKHHMEKLLEANALETRNAEQELALLRDCQDYGQYAEWLAGSSSNSTAQQQPQTKTTTTTATTTATKTKEIKKDNKKDSKKDGKKDGKKKNKSWGLGKKEELVPKNDKKEIQQALANNSGGKVEDALDFTPGELDDDFWGDDDDDVDVSALGLKPVESSSDEDEDDVVIETAQSDSESEDEVNPALAQADDDSSDDEVNPMLAQAKDDSSDDEDEVNPMLAQAKDDSSDDEDEVNPMLAQAKDDSSDDEDEVNPMLAQPKDDSSDDEDEVNPMLAHPKDDSSDDEDEVNPMLSQPVDDDSSDDDAVNPMLAQPVDDSSDDDAVNPMLAQPVDDSSDDDAVNPMLAQPIDLDDGGNDSESSSGKKKKKKKKKHRKKRDDDDDEAQDGEKKKKKKHRKKREDGEKRKKKKKKNRKKHDEEEDDEEDEYQTL